jgi:hypothetical protein
MRARIGEQVTVRGVRGEPDRVGRVRAIVVNSKRTCWYSVEHDDGTRSDRVPASRIQVYRLPVFEELMGRLR